MSAPTPASIRKDLRQLVKQLLTGIEGLGTVETGKHHLPDNNDDLPLTRIKTPQTTPTDDNSDETDLDIEIQITHYAVAPAGSQTSIDDLLDTASGLIYQALYQQSRAALAAANVYRIVPGPQIQEISDEGDLPAGLCLDTYTLSVIFPKNTPSE